MSAHLRAPPSSGKVDWGEFSPVQDQRSAHLCALPLSGKADWGDFCPVQDQLSTYLCALPLPGIRIPKRAQKTYADRGRYLNKHSKPQKVVLVAKVYIFSVALEALVAKHALERRAGSLTKKGRKIS